MAQHDVYVLVLSPLTLINAPRKTEKEEEVKWGGGGRGGGRQTDGRMDGPMDERKQSGRESGEVWLDNTGITIILIIKQTEWRSVYIYIYIYRRQHQLVRNLMID